MDRSISMLNKDICTHSYLVQSNSSRQAVTSCDPHYKSFIDFYIICLCIVCLKLHIF